MSQPYDFGASVLLVESAGLADGESAARLSLGDADVKAVDTNAPMQLGLRFLQIARLRNEATLVSTSGAQYSYSSMASAAFELSRILAGASRGNAGNEHGDRVVVLLPNSPEYIAAFYGVLMAGGVVVPVAPKIEAETLRRIVETTQATQIITTPAVLSSRADLGRLAAQPVDWASPHSLDDRDPPSLMRTFEGHDDNHLAAIFFTGGSSGTPKGVMLSHRNLISNAESIREYLQLTESENPLCVLPFMHAFGNSVLQSHMLVGSKLTFAGHTAFPQTIVDSLRSHACTSLSGVPDLFRMLLSRTSLGQQPLPHLRYMAVAGGALPQNLSLELAEKIAPSQFFVMYGQTEATARLAYVPPAQLDDRPDGAIGEPIPGVMLDIANEAGETVSPGEVGELRARGPNIMLGYWNDPDETVARLRDGWLLTGDLACRDDDGWLVLRGRSNSFVKIAGFRVHPQELEDFAVRRLQAMQAVAVPVTGAVGTRLALFLKYPSEHSPAVAELTATCRQELPHYLAPEIIQCVDEFPLNHAMKIDRPALTSAAEKALTERRASA